jgi:CheY-like chemotaxis protein
VDIDCARTPDQERRTVLLAEDDPQIRLLVTLVLEGEGLTVLGAANATEALATFDNRPQQIHLLVTDVEMGEPTDGFALAERVRLKAPGLPVLVISGVPQSERSAGERRLPFLAKPFTVQDLIRRVQELLEGRDEFSRQATIRSAELGTPQPPLPSDLLSEVHQAKRVYQDAAVRSSALVEHAMEIGLDSPDGAHAFRTAVASERAALAKFNSALKALNDAIRRGRGQHRRQLLESLLDTTLEFARARKGFIHVFNADEDVLSLEAQRGFDERTSAVFRRVCEDTFACGRAFRTAQRTIVEDIIGSPILQNGISRATLLAAGIRAVQSTPLFSPEGTPVGTLSTYYTKPKRPSEQELQLIDQLASQASSIIFSLHGR